MYQSKKTVSTNNSFEPQGKKLHTVTEISVVKSSNIRGNIMRLCFTRRFCKNMTKMNTYLHFQIYERGWGFSTVSSAALDSFMRK